MDKYLMKKIELSEDFTSKIKPLLAFRDCI